MSDEAAFLRAIQANPTDANAKLVYADWLDERGEPVRAEYVRLVANGKSSYGREGFAPHVGESWLDMFHNRVPLWDPVTLLALGRLDGWFAAFAKCSQHAANIEYAFQSHLLPRYGSLQAMVDDWFGVNLQPIRLEQLSDWQRDLRQVLHLNLLGELGQITCNSDTQLALQVNNGREWIINAVEDQIFDVIRPTAVWQVHVSRNPKVWYALAWTDLMLEAADRVLFLHFSFSD